MPIQDDMQRWPAKIDGEPGEIKHPVAWFTSYHPLHYYCMNPGLPWTNFVNPEADLLRAFPLVVSRRVHIDRIGFWLQGDGGAGARARLGIYADNGRVYPGNLVPNTDVAELVCDAGDSPIWRENIIDVWLDPDLCWLVFLHNDAGVDVQQITNAAGYAKPPILGATTGGAQADTEIFHSYAYGPLPSTFPSTAPGYASYLWNIMVRVTFVM